MFRKKILITGGAGFIGSHTVDLLLSQGHKVVVIDDLSGGRLTNIAHNLDSSNFEFYETNILDVEPDTKIFSEIDCVIHFAGIGDIVPSINKPVDYYTVNCLGTAKILEACRYHKVKRFVYAASSSCYGIATVPTDESHPISPQYPYALTKYLGELTAFHWGKVYGIEINSIRIFNAYGTRSKTSGNYGAVFGVFLKQIIENLPLTVVGDGNQSRDFVYVTDVAEAFVLAAFAKKSGEIYNLGAGNPVTINEIIKILDAKAEFIPERPGEPRITWANISKISTELNWKPKTGIEAGVSNLLDDLDYWSDAPLWTSDKIRIATQEWFNNLNKRTGI
jgi:UDP-glucose 4-epimerase